MGQVKLGQRRQLGDLGRHRLDGVTRQRQSGNLPQAEDFRRHGAELVARENELLQAQADEIRVGLIGNVTTSRSSHPQQVSTHVEQLLP